LGLAGQVFWSPMPGSAYDRERRLLAAFREARVSVVTLLAEREECLRYAGVDLPAVYAREGFELIHLPVPDFQVPDRAVLEPAVGTTLARARAGQHVVIHCHAGRGRTGLFAACLAREALGLSGEEAIAWVRRAIPGAVETVDQINLVLTYRP
jgi:protein-tyrosine phosphatase